MRRQTQILLALAILGIWILVHGQLSRMDGVFFQPSLSGAKGLVLYSLEAYEGAAEAYRAHQREEFRAGRTTGSPARDALLRGDTGRAEELAGRALQHAPDDHPTLLLLAEIVLERDRPAHALDLVSKVLREDPRSLNARLLAALAHTELKAYDRALDSLKLALRPGNSGSWRAGFLSALRTTGRLTALPQGERPSCLVAHYYRYLRIFDESNGRLAVAYAREAVEAGDRPDDAHVTIGVVAHKQERLHEALAAFQKAVEANPNNAEAYRWAATTHADVTPDLTAQLRMWRGAYEAAPEDPFYADAFSRFLVDTLGDYPRALAIDLRSAERRPDAAEVRHRIAASYRVLGQHDLALTHYRKALEDQPTNADLYEGMAFSLTEMGRTQEAVRTYHKALELDPRQPRVHLALSDIYRKEFRFEETLRAMEAAYELGYRDLEFWRHLCGLYDFLKHTSQAETCYAGFRRAEWREAQGPLSFTPPIIP